MELRARPALVGSVALHAAVILAALIVLPRIAPPVTPQSLGAPVPVTLIAEAPQPAPRPAPRPTPAATPAPVPDASTEAPGEEAPPAPEPPPPPNPAPTPTPPQPRVAPPPEPRPQPRPAQPRPTPPRPVAPAAVRPPAPQPRPAPRPPAPQPRPAPRQPSLDLDAIARSAPNRTPRAQQQARLDLDSLSNLAPRPAPGPRLSSAAQGPPRPRAGPSGPSGSAGRSEETALALGIIQERVTRNWNLDCANPDFAALRVRVTVNLNQNGGLIGEPRADISDEGGTRGVAAQRAIAAVRRAAPFDTLPPERYAEWRNVILNFNAREACRG